MRIGLHTSVDMLREAFANSGCLRLPGTLEPELSTHALRRIIQRSKGEPFYAALAEKVVLHPSADDSIFDELITACSDFDVLNAIALSRRAPEHLLRRLLTTSGDPVKQHAELNLLRREIELASPERLREILRAHSATGGIDIPVRILLASRENLPPDLRLQLSRDPVDLVREKALQHG
jgi:hypothetical protein